MDSEQLFALPDEQLLEIIESQDPTVFGESYTIDWGSSRGQGKRIGKMIVGAMSDISIRGKKKYYDLFAKLNLTDLERTEATGFKGIETVRYLKARAAGLDHDYAACFAYDGMKSLRTYNARIG